MGEMMIGGCLGHHCREKICMAKAHLGLRLASTVVDNKNLSF